jgi:tetratricopeptide (TPR) repeat protein
MSENNEIENENKRKIELLINKAINEFNLKEYTKSINLFDQVIKIDSKILDVYTFKGLSFKNLNRNDEAIACFNKVIELNPKNIDAYKYVAYTYIFITKI